MALYKEGKKIKSIYKNGEKIAAIYQNGEKIYSNLQKEKRYLLCSDGAQYISTFWYSSIANGKFFDIKMSAAMIANPSGETNQVNGNVSNWLFFGVDNAGRYQYPGFNDNSVAYTDNALHDYFMTCVFMKAQLNLSVSSALQIDGAIVASGSEKKMFFPGNAGFNLFASVPLEVNPAQTAENYMTQKIESVQLYDNGLLVRDMWAAPSGSQLYDANTPAPSNCLYCKVSQQYFENQGQGAFTIETI